MAKSRNKRKNKGKAKQQFAKLSPKGYIKKVARKLPVECKIISDWEERGNTQIMVIRKRTNGQYIVGFYMVDIWCLGLKDTFYRHDLEAYEFEEMVEKFNEDMSGEQLIDCDPQLAYNIIYGCIEYAEDLGFSPAKDFAITEYILDDVDEIDFVEVEFGKDGQPFYFSGPYDNVKKNLSILNKNVGEGNYHFVTHLDDDDDDFGFLENAEFTAEDIKTNPYTTRPGVAKILRRLGDEDKSAYLLQLQIADKLHQMFGGDLASIEENYDEDLVDDIAHAVLEDFESIETIEDDEEEGLEDYIYMLTQITLSQIRDRGDAEFLFEEGYSPTMRPPDLEELKNLPPEEAAEKLIDFVSNLIPSGKEDIIIETVLMKELSALFGENEEEEERSLTAAEKEQLHANVLQTIKKRKLLKNIDDATLSQRIQAEIEEWEEEE